MTGKYQLTRTADGKITTFRTGEVLEVKNGDEAWVYYVEETEPPEGYGKDGYGTKNTTETGTTITKAQGATTATNGGVIMNRESFGYELPQDRRNRHDALYGARRSHDRCGRCGADDEVLSPKKRKRITQSAGAG